MTDTKLKKAIIYTRVASAPVNSEDAAIAAKERRCREHARQQGYDVVATFHDVAPGTIAARPGLNEMFGFLDERRPEPFAVVVDDVGVLARDMSVYVELRHAISERGAILKACSGAFGKEYLMENLGTGIAQCKAGLRSRDEFEDACDVASEGTGIE